MGSVPYLPDIGRFIVRGGGGFAYGGGYVPVGNNPVVSPWGGGSGGSSSGGGPSGPQIAPLEMVWVDPGVLGIGTLYKPWYQHILDFGWDGLIGIGDMASWSLTRCLRQSLGLDEYVDYDSPGYKYAPWAYMLLSGGAGGVAKGAGTLSVRGGNKLKPNPEAIGAHTTFRRNPQTGRVSNYVEFDKSGNPVKRFRGEGRPPKGGGRLPVIYEPKNSGGYPRVPRDPTPDELPKGY